jgi:phosphoribosylaminoimidazolecarboxamide formyltransferase/IMP cyclohydrolase
MSPGEILHPQRALISVYDKTGIVDFARALHEYGVEILSSDGTAAALTEEDIPVTEVRDYTGVAEMFSGRVKTLHPRIHGGILARRPVQVRTGHRLDEATGDMAEMEKHDIPPIDLVCVNLYPFSEVVSRPDATLHDALENIDIGGPTLIRAAAKNFPCVCVVTDPSQYHPLLVAWREYTGIPRFIRESFARAAFHYTAVYDAAIARYFRSLPPSDSDEDWIMERVLPQRLPLALTKVRDLRYGENPHQRAAYYRLDAGLGDYISDSEIIQGKEISYNNLLDIDAVVRICREFPGKICAAVVKHQNPTGVAIADTPEEAYRKARAVDELAAFGNVTGISGIVDAATAKAVSETFVEVVVAPDFTGDALQILGKKKNLRLVKTDLIHPLDVSGRLEGRALIHGVLVQEIDTELWDDERFVVASKRKPTDEQMQAMELAWRVVKHVRSNSTVLATPTQTVGTGPGQTSRVDTFKIAIEKAGDRARGAVAATDGFCFPDSIEISHAAGLTAIIEPGGSKQDQETIAKADELGMVLVMTGMRHFKH